MVLTVSFVLSLVSRLVVTIASAMRSIVADLISASGYQDHTTSPSAPVSTKALSAVLVPVPPKLERRRISVARLATLRVHRIPSLRP
jgi:hypothetical protein